MPKTFFMQDSHHIEVDDDNVVTVKFYKHQFNKGGPYNLLNFNDIITATLNLGLMKKVVFERKLVDGPLEIRGLDNLEEIKFLIKTPAKEFLKKIPKRVKISGPESIADNNNNNDNNNNKKRTFEAPVPVRKQMRETPPISAPSNNFSQEQNALIAQSMGYGEGKDQLLFSKTYDINSNTEHPYYGVLTQMLLLKEQAAAQENGFSRLRHHQKIGYLETVDALHKEKKELLYQYATGTGKTIQFCELSASFILGSKKNVVILVPTQILREQTVDAFKSLGYEFNVNMIKSGQELNEHKASLATEAQAYIMTYDLALSGQESNAEAESLGKMTEYIQYSSLVVLDEAHLSLSYSEKIQKFRTINPNIVIAAVSATPSYNLKSARIYNHVKDMLKIEDNPITKFDLIPAIEAGVNCPVKTYVVYPTTPVVKNATIDENDESASDNLLKNNEAYLKMVVSALLNGQDTQTKDAFRYKKVIINCVGIEHAEKVAKLINETVGDQLDLVDPQGLRRNSYQGKDYQVCAAIHSKSTKPEEILKKYKAGGIQYLAGDQMLINGFDVPETSVVINARPTTSEPVCLQRAGRALRLDPANPNKIAYIIDICPFENKKQKMFSFYLSDNINEHKFQLGDLASKVVEPKLAEPINIPGDTEVQIIDKQPEQNAFHFKSYQNCRESYTKQAVSKMKSTHVLRQSLEKFGSVTQVLQKLTLKLQEELGKHENIRIDLKDEEEVPKRNIKKQKLMDTDESNDSNEQNPLLEELNAADEDQIRKNLIMIKKLTHELKSVISALRVEIPDENKGGQQKSSAQPHANQSLALNFISSMERLEKMVSHFADATTQRLSISPNSTRGLTIQAPDILVQTLEQRINGLVTSMDRTIAFADKANLQTIKENLKKNEDKRKEVPKTAHELLQEAKEFFNRTEENDMGFEECFKKFANANNQYFKEKPEHAVMGEASYYMAMCLYLSSDKRYMPISVNAYQALSATAYPLNDSQRSTIRRVLLDSHVGLCRVNDAIAMLNDQNRVSTLKKLAKNCLEDKKYQDLLSVPEAHSDPILRELGQAAFELKNYAKAKSYLERFLEKGGQSDNEILGWLAQANEALKPVPNSYELPNQYTNAFLDGFRNMTATRAYEIINNHFQVPAYLLSRFQAGIAQIHELSLSEKIYEYMKDPDKNLDVLIALHHPQAIFKHVTILNEAHNKILKNDPDNFLNINSIMSELSKEDADELSDSCESVIEFMPYLHDLQWGVSKEGMDYVLEEMEAELDSFTLRSYYFFTLRPLFFLADEKRFNYFASSFRMGLPFFEIKGLADTAHAYLNNFKKGLNARKKVSENNVSDAAISYGYFSCALKLLRNEKIKSYYEYLFYYDHPHTYLKLIGNASPRLSVHELELQFEELKRMMGKNLVKHVAKLDSLFMPHDGGCKNIYAAEGLFYFKRYAEASVFFNKAKAESMRVSPGGMIHTKQRLAEIENNQSHTSAPLLNQFSAQQTQASQVSAPVPPPKFMQK